MISATKRKELEKLQEEIKQLYSEKENLIQRRGMKARKFDAFHTYTLQTESVENDSTMDCIPATLFENTFYTSHNALYEELSNFHLSECENHVSSKAQLDTSFVLCSEEYQNDTKYMVFQDTSTIHYIPMEAAPHTDSWNERVLFIAKQDKYDSSQIDKDTFMYIIKTPFLLDGSYEISNEDDQSILDHLWIEIDELSQTLQNLYIDKSLRDWRFQYQVEQCTKYGARRYDSYDPSVFKDVNYKEWEDTFFYTHPIPQYEMAHTILSKDMEKQLKDAQKDYPSWIGKRDYTYGSYLVSCESCINTPDGIKLVVADPHGYIITEPIKDITIEFAESLIDKILKIELGFQYDSNRHPVKSFYLTGYNKYES